MIKYNLVLWATSVKRLLKGFIKAVTCILLVFSFTRYEWSDEDNAFMGSWGPKSRTAVYERDYCTNVLGKQWTGPNVMPENTHRENEKIRRDWQRQNDLKDPKDRVCGGAWCCTGGKILVFLRMT